MGERQRETTQEGRNDLYREEILRFLGRKRGFDKVGFEK